MSLQVYHGPIAPAELIVDSFAGGGGASLGIERGLGRRVDVAINHDPGAIAMHRANHPLTLHHTEDVWKINPRAVTQGRPVGLLWASPDCKHFSRAKGAQPKDQKIRSLAWVVCLWAAEARPRVILLENVREFAEWGPLVPRWACRDCDWKGTEGQATLVRRRHARACPECEGRALLEERGPEGKPVLVPDPARKGLTFRRWTGRLRNLGYEMAWRVLDAADYGAPTHRKRLFLVARNDGARIVWPEPTHRHPSKITVGEDLTGRAFKPYEMIADRIDWGLPCPSIFLTREEGRAAGVNRPLAEPTMRRIAHGVDRYVLKAAEPFLVRLTHQGGERVVPVSGPVPTVTGAHRGELGLVVPGLVRYNGEKGAAGAHVHDVRDPLGTVPTENRFGLLAAALVQTGYGERVGQTPRALDLRAPMGTAVDGCKQALVAAFIHKYFGGHTTPGSPAGAPLDTITAWDHNSLVAANLVHMNHGEKTWSGCAEPMRTLTTGNHAYLVYSFLVKYFGTAIGASLLEPMPTQTSKDRLGLVVVRIMGEPYVIVDIGLRMLTPRELARGQGCPDTYKLVGTKTEQVKRIGNMVCPVMAEVLARANLGAHEMARSD